jgi:lipid A ethanolaminephosphotransferase
MSLPFLKRAEPISPWALIVGVSAYLAVVGNWALWHALWSLPEWHQQPTHWLMMTGFSAVFVLIVCVATVGVFTLSAWPWVLKPVLIFSLLISAGVNHFIYCYGTLIDGYMLQNIFQTQVHEAQELLTIPLFLQVLILGVVPSYMVWRTPIRWLTVWGQSIRNLVWSAVSFLVAVLLTWSVFQTFASLMRNHEQLRLMITPLNTFYAVGDYFRIRQPIRPLMPIGLDAHQEPLREGQQPLFLVLVVGETARSDHLSLNGYERLTNPQLESIPNLVSLRHVMSCGTATAISLPCLFSHLGRAGQNADPTENLLDLLQRAGLFVLWVDNQAGCKEQCDRVNHVQLDPAKLHASFPNTCRTDECFDEMLLVDLKQRIGQLAPQKMARGVVVVLHQMGSHGPAYGLRSPLKAKVFHPECQDVALQNCSLESVRNAYDNSIVYTDLFLSRLIEWLDRENPQGATGMMYISDHGESLGENNIYLHGLPYRFAPQAQKHVPWLIWLSQQFQLQQKINMQCLNQQRNEPRDHDYYFHSVLGLLGIQTQVYQEKKDIFYLCRH